MVNDSRVLAVVAHCKDLGRVAGHHMMDNDPKFLLDPYSKGLEGSGAEYPRERR
jgi:hypothetical protein